MNNFKLLASYPASVPRYTSYPTAPHFKLDLGRAVLNDLHGAISDEDRISLYIHIPFCDRLCWFCGCHTKQTQNYAPVARYIETLIAEMRLQAAAIAKKPKLAHVHFGGGSPSMLRSDDFNAISSALNTHFMIDPETEISVEIDPNDMSDELMDGLSILGVTRASIGVQDFDKDVQDAINRPQTYEQTRDLVAALRQIGIKSMNIDALYGLPRQNAKRLRATIEKVISLEPDRVAMFGYAHVPWIKKHQKMISDNDLPNNYQRYVQMQISESLLVKSGLAKIGIDHFAKPSDSLSLAQKSGTLHRNFQGYTTDNCKILLGLGASSIGRFDDGYVQNLVPTNLYTTKIKMGELAAAKGYRLTNDDEIRAFMIEQMMCYFKISFVDLINRFGGAAMPYIELAKKYAREDQNHICDVTPDIIFIKPEHLPLTRIAASWFDKYLETNPYRYSKAV